MRLDRRTVRRDLQTAARHPIGPSDVAEDRREIFPAILKKAEKA
jgi:hypothetical protein